MSASSLRGGKGHTAMASGEAVELLGVRYTGGMLDNSCDDSSYVVYLSPMHLCRMQGRVLDFKADLIL